MNKKLFAFPYYGGKYTHLEWLLPLLPKDIDKLVYVEPFGGSMAVLLNKKPSKYEIYNDLNSDVVNFFRVLRDEKKREKLLENIFLMPYSREEYKSFFDEENCDIKRAVNFYCKIRMSINALAEKKCQFRLGFTSNSPLTRRIRNSVEPLWEVSNRILDVHIENKCAIELIKQCDRKNAFFYVDPPYQHDTRQKAYCTEFYDHEQLEETLKNIKGRFLLSGYGEYKSLNLIKEVKVKAFSSQRSKKAAKERIEKVWSNYTPVIEQTLFDDL